MVVVDLRDLRFIETLGSRPGEPDLSSKPAVGDARVAQPHDFLDALRDDLALPELGVERAEARCELGLVLEHGVEIRGLAGHARRDVSPTRWQA